MNEKKLSPNMQHALDAVRKAHPQPFTTASATLLKGLAALERRGLVKMVGERIPYQPPSYVLADDPT